MFKMLKSLFKNIVFKRYLIEYEKKFAMFSKFNENFYLQDKSF